MKIVPTTRGLRAALLTSATLMLSIPLTSVQAQDEVLEEIVTTGSRIVRDEFSSSSPITVVTGEEIALSGVVSIDEYLKDIPSFTGYQMGSQTNNGSDAGQKKIDLRGLGFNRTLVLINGRRMIGDAYVDGAVDLNAIPEAMIKRVEVLKDGASTIYGSDALAGVINIILHDDFEGFELSARYGEGMEDGQAANAMLALMAGVSGDRGNMVMSISYTNQDEMLQSERPWAVDATYPQLDGSGNFQPVASGSSNSRTLRMPFGSFTFDTGLGQARPFDSTTDTYNYAPVNALTQPNERWQMAMNGTVSVNDSLEGYMEAMYTRRTSQQRLAPDASFQTTMVETPNNGFQWNDFVPANNPYNPFGVNASGPDGILGTPDDLNALGMENLDARISRRFTESGGRKFRQTADTYRLVAGLRGEILEGAIGWDVTYMYAENETLSETINYGRFDRWAIAVDPVACAADPVCAGLGVLNPFDDFGTISDGQMGFLTTGSLKDLIGSKMEVAEVNFNGELGEMSGGSVGWAAGYLHRRESGLFSPDEFLAGGLTTGGASDPLNGKFSVDEFYGEVLLPVADNFDLSASVRFSDYDTVGNATTYKIGGDWAVTDALRLRATYSTGFRAPNISEINSQNKATFPVVDSVCEFADRRLAMGDITQTVMDNCLALIGTAGGLDDSFVSDAGEFGFAWQSLMTFRSPASPLEPEDSTSYNFGVVFQPSFLEGLSVGIDYWNIEVEKAIGTDDIHDLFNACMGSVNLTDPSCADFDFGPYFPDFFFFFPGDVTVDYGNLGTISTDGVDIDIAYAGELGGAITGYDLYWNSTYMNSYESQFPGGRADIVGTADGFAIFPEWRMSFGAGIFGDNWTANWNGRFIDETIDRRRPCYLTDDCIAESVIYHDLVATYTWENVTFNLGVRNVGDESPPRFHSAFNANTEPGTYDVVGRAYYTGFRLTF